MAKTNNPGSRLNQNNPSVINFKNIYRSKFIYLALLPTFILLTIFSYYPFFNAFYRSLYDWNGVNVSKFVGLNNFTQILTKDPLFWPSMGRMAIFTLADLVKSLVVPLVVALLIHHIASSRAKYYYRVAVILPAVAPGIVGLMIWKDFMSSNGIINQLLRIIGLGSLTNPWLGDIHTVVAAIIMIGFPWVNGANSLIYLSGLIGISRDLYDAAKVDGIGVWQRLWRIEIPLVIPQIRVLATLSLIASIQSYENILILTGGGPGGSSMVPGLLLYKNAFSYNKLGYASAIGVILFFIIIFLTIMIKKQAKE